MSLTVKEKEHWKERIARRIDQAIEDLQATQDAAFCERIQREAAEQAWKSLGLQSLRDEIDEIESEMARLRNRREDIWAEMLSEVSATPLGEVLQQGSRPFEVTAAQIRRRAVLERELLAATTLGQTILRLRQEKEELLDTVWLATSPAQIKKLWSRFAELLKWEPPKLQQEALAIELLSTRP